MSIDELAELIKQPPIECRPEVRWWLAEGLHTDETLRYEIDTAHRLGFGGMEFLAMDEGAIDHSRYGWGSEEWTHDTQVVVEETTRRQMAVSFTSGTNWSNANLPTITPDQPAAAQELDVVAEDLSAGTHRSGPLPRIDLAAPTRPSIIPGHRGVITEQSLVAAVAAKIIGRPPNTDAADPDGQKSLPAMPFGQNHAPTILAADSITVLTDQVNDGVLDWTAPDDGDWRLFCYWMHGTGQTASPSVSTNYTVNYLDPDGVRAVIDYWDSVVLTPELRAEIADNPRTQMYMDSLELSTFGAGNLFWGHTVAAEFATRRGYSIEPWLPFLTRDVGMMAAATSYHYESDADHQPTIDKVRFDYVRTLTDLYIENMLRPFATFLHSRGIGLRSEISYGLPFELTRPGPEVDGIETESLEFAAQIDAYRLLAGPAHLFGKQYSSETGATTRNHILDHRFYDQIIATQLAAGITKTVLHGWASTAGAEGATEWPGHEGMLPLFSERFDTRQPAAEFYPQWTTALGRAQCLLRQGKPRIDVGILRTDHFTDNMSGMAFQDAKNQRVPDEEAYGRWWMRNRQNHWWADLGMQDAGWTYEFFDGSLLLRDDVHYAETVQPDGPGYQALIIFQSQLDADVAQHLLGWAEQGCKIVIVHGARELKLLMADQYTQHEQAASATPGLDGRDEELAAIMQQLLAQPSVREASDPTRTVATLRELGVVGRAEFVADNPSVLTHLRADGDLLHLYAYNFLYQTGEPTTVEVSLPGRGIAYRIDPWTGRLRPYRGCRAVGDRTVLTIDLAPGETALFTLDRSAESTDSEPVAIETVAELTDWSTTVESWDAGELRTITEDRGLGYQSVEVRPTTAVTSIAVGSADLQPWKDLPAVGPEVSGVGDYRSQVRVVRPAGAGERYLLDLGSTAGGLGSVSINDGEAIGFDTSRPVIDVTDQLRAGDNQVTVRTASSLNNRLLARGYYDKILDVASQFGGGEPQTQQTSPHDHGLLGPVRLLRES